MPVPSETSVKRGRQNAGVVPEKIRASMFRPPGWMITPNATCSHPDGTRRSRGRNLRPEDNRRRPAAFRRSQHGNGRARRKVAAGDHQHAYGLLSGGWDDAAFGLGAVPLPSGTENLAGGNSDDLILKPNPTVKLDSPSPAAGCFQDTRQILDMRDVIDECIGGIARHFVRSYRLLVEVVHEFVNQRERDQLHVISRQRELSEKGCLSRDQCGVWVKRSASKRFSFALKTLQEGNSVY